MKQVFIPTQPVAKRLKDFQEVELGFAKRVVVDEARKFPQSHDPSCQPKCPLGIQILEFVRFLREGQVPEAYKKIREANDLPGICGRICLAPCEEEFVIGGKKVPVDIRAMERFVADHGRPKFFGRDKLTCAKSRVAVIGSGPAGLSAAAVLARELYCVTVFESLPLLGGVLRYGVPEFRLPKSVLEAEIGQVRDLGVDFQVNMTLGTNLTFEKLMAEGFSAVLLAVGKSHPKFLDLPGTDAQGVFYAQELLMRLNFSKAVFAHEFGGKLGRRVAVIGDQNIALDCARVCRRLGKQVSLVFTGTDEDLDMHRNELSYGREEGVDFQAMMRPMCVEVGPEGAVTGLRCQKMDFAERNGQWVLMPVPQAEHLIEADSIVIAKGYEVNLFLKKVFPHLKFTKNGTVWIDEQTAQTSVDKVFAAGDLIDPREHILDSMVSGRWVAEKIMKFLS